MATEFGEALDVMCTVDIRDGASGEDLRTESTNWGVYSPHGHADRMGVIMEHDAQRGRYLVNFTHMRDLIVWSGWFLPTDLRRSDLSGL